MAAESKRAFIPCPRRWSDCVSPARVIGSAFMSTSQRVSAGAAAVGCLPALWFAAAAHAGPVDGVVRAGTAVISQAGATTTVTQTSARAVIDWRSFDIAAGETVAFH